MKKISTISDNFDTLDTSLKHLAAKNKLKSLPHFIEIITLVNKLVKSGALPLLAQLMQTQFENTKNETFNKLKAYRSAFVIHLHDDFHSTEEDENDTEDSLSVFFKHVKNFCNDMLITIRKDKNPVIFPIKNLIIENLKKLSSSINFLSYILSYIREHKRHFFTAMELEKKIYLIKLLLEGFHERDFYLKTFNNPQLEFEQLDLKIYKNSFILVNDVQLFYIPLNGTSCHKVEINNPDNFSKALANINPSKKNKIILSRVKVKNLITANCRYDPKEFNEQPTESFLAPLNHYSIELMTNIQYFLETEPDCGYFTFKIINNNLTINIDSYSGIISQLKNIGECLEDFLPDEGKKLKAITSKWNEYHNNKLTFNYDLASKTSPWLEKILDTLKVLEGNFIKAQEQNYYRSFPYLLNDNNMVMENLAESALKQISLTITLADGSKELPIVIGEDTKPIFEAFHYQMMASEVTQVLAILSETYRKSCEKNHALKKYLFHRSFTSNNIEASDKNHYKFVLKKMALIFKRLDSDMVTPDQNLAMESTRITNFKQ